MHKIEKFKSLQELVAHLDKSGDQLVWCFDHGYMIEVILKERAKGKSKK